jgi:hypothetical protein
MKIKLLAACILVGGSHAVKNELNMLSRKGLLQQLSIKADATDTEAQETGLVDAEYNATTKSPIPSLA